MADYKDLKIWQEALSFAERVQRLAAGSKAPEARSTLGRLSDAAAGVPGRIAQAWRRAQAGEDPAALLQQAESRLLDAETYLLLSVRLGYLEQEAVNRVLTIQAGLLSHLTAADWTGPANQASSPTAVELSSPAPAPRVASEAPRRPRPSPQLAEEYHEPVDRLVVDGCNFLGCAAGYSLGDERSRDRLLFRLQEYARRHPAHRVVVFFDGQRASRRLTAGVEERVTSGNRPADDVIIDFLDGLPPQDRPRCTLVTDDRELVQRAKRVGTRVEGIGDLAGKLARHASGFKQREDGLNQGALAEWEEFFSHPPKRPGKG